MQEETLDPEMFARNIGIKLRQGRWAPDQAKVLAHQVQFRKANEEQKNVQGRLAGVIAIFITLMIVMSILPMEASCFFSLMLFFTFGIVVAMVVILTNRVKPAPYADWAQQYPVVEIDRTIVHFNSREIDFQKIGGAEVDRYHNEFLIIEKTLSRRSISLDAYENVNH